MRRLPFIAAASAVAAAFSLYVAYRVLELREAALAFVFAALAFFFGATAYSAVFKPENLRRMPVEVIEKIAPFLLLVAFIALCILVVGHTRVTR